MASAQNPKMVIRTQDGKYLGGDANGLRLLHEVYGAVLFEPGSEQLQEVLRALRQVSGLEVQAVPIELEQVFEICDGCGELAVPFQVFFDGCRFLCRDCAAEPPKRS